MKLNKLYFALAAAALLSFAACSDINEIAPAGGALLETQLQQTNVADPAKGEASFNGLFTYLGAPNNPLGGSTRPDCYSFIMITFCDDLEGADMWIADSGYNWFRVCGELSSRNANFRNPGVRYKSPYDLIGLCNTFITSYPADVDDPNIIAMIAQAYALRAFAYQRLAINFQFGPTIAPDGLCVPIVTPETEDFTNNPRATVTEVYNLIISDLNYAVDHLGDYTRPGKARINKAVALGLRARTYLAMGEWDKANADATAAIAEATKEGIAPKTAAEIETSLKDGTAFESITEKDWMWGYDMTEVVAAAYPYATSSSWLRSFSANGYAPACQVYSSVNTLLYNKIPATDIRKQWWVDENLKSKLLNYVTWEGNDVATYSDGGDTKMPFQPYTNVKFGCNPIATTTNDEDFPFMRIDEMYLIQAEAQEHITAGKGATILTNYVKTYRDPAYDVNGRNLSILDEIWFQRRVELWGEGFYTFDLKRLGKNLVRFHGSGTNVGNFPDAFKFNLAKDDAWLNMRFSQGELDTNKGIVDNTGSKIPEKEQNPDLRDGVTD